MLKYLIANDQPQSVDAIQAQFAQHESAVIIRSLGWLCKLGLISISEND